MRTRITNTIFALIFALLNTCPAVAEESLTGAWYGMLEQVGLRIVFHIEQDGNQLRATMDSPDQGASGIGVDATELNGNELSMTIKLIRGEFVGNLVRDDAGNITSIDGSWMQSGTSIPLVLSQEELKKITRSQDPTPPYPYLEEEVSFKNPSANTTIAGTLTIPKTAGPHPAALLITGSGPQNRDEELMNHRPFWVIADYLSRNGIAVLRVDDRGVGGSTGNFALATSFDFATDVEASMAFLKKHPKIHKQKIGLIGHSEGGLIAPIVGARSKDVAFIVLLAGPGVTGEEILKEQQKLILKANGTPDSLVEAYQYFSSKIFQQLKSTDKKIDMGPLVQEVVKNAPEEIKSSLNTILNTTQNGGIKSQLAQMNTPWFRLFLTYDPTEYLRQLSMPVLALNGENDLQVPATQNLPKIEAALKAGNNSNYTIKSLPGLNHLFQHSSTGSPNEYGMIDETFSPEVLEIMEAWINDTVKLIR